MSKDTILELLKEYNINYVLNQSPDIKFYGFVSARIQSLN